MNATGVRNVLGKKKIKAAEKKGALCQTCDWDFHDKISLDRHIDWAHRAQKSTVKT
jgi:hypothetical protein